MTSNVIGPSRESVTNSAPSSDPVRFCKDCKHWVPYDAPESRFTLSSCAHPAVEMYWSRIAGTRGKRLVSGVRQTGTFAENERGRKEGDCGESGALFEQRPEARAVPSEPAPAPAPRSLVLVHCIVLGLLFGFVFLVWLIRRGGAL